MPYVGLVASPKRGAGVIDELRADGVPEEHLELIDVPAGIDIGARTPAEIALSILATVVAVRRGERAAAPAARAGPRRPAPPRRQLAVDPICGMTVAVVAGTPSVEVEGETVYFCCEGCATKFQAQHEHALRLSDEPARGHGRGGRRDPPARARHRDARPASRRGRLPRRRGPRDVDVPEPAPAAAAAARGRGGRRQDRGRQVARGRARHAADPPAVLRGDRRGGGAVRVELPAPAAEHPPRRLARLGRSARRSCSARTT